MATAGWVQSFNPQKSCRLGRLYMGGKHQNDPWIVIVEHEHIVSHVWIWKPEEYSLALTTYRLMANQVQPYIEKERRASVERTAMYS